jgi:hypothetical protein
MLRVILYSGPLVTGIASSHNNCSIITLKSAGNISSKIGLIYKSFRSCHRVFLVHGSRQPAVPAAAVALSVQSAGFTMVILPALQPHDFGRRCGDLLHQTALATNKTMFMKR